MDDPTDIFNVVKTLLHVKSTMNIFKVLCQLTFPSPKSTIETLEKKCETVNNTNTRRRHERRSGVFIVKFRNISDLFLVFLLLTLNK